MTKTEIATIFKGENPDFEWVNKRQIQSLKYDMYFYVMYSDGGSYKQSLHSFIQLLMFDNGEMQSCFSSDEWQHALKSKSKWFDSLCSEGAFGKNLDYSHYEMFEHNLNQLLGYWYQMLYDAELLDDDSIIELQEYGYLDDEE